MRVISMWWVAKMQKNKYSKMGRVVNSLGTSGLHSTRGY